jgi:C4-type Zn-finger protein
MMQDGLLSEQQDEIRKLTLMVNDISGRSIVGNSSIKNGSIIIES